MASGRRLLVAAIALGLACTDDRQITPPTAVTLSVFPDTATVVVGDSVFLVSVARDRSGHSYVGAPTNWSSSNRTVATVSATGVAKGVAAGEDTITATSGGLSAKAVVTVVPQPFIAFTRDSVGFNAIANGPNPAPDTVLVANGGGGTLGTVGLSGVSYGPGATGWLTPTLSGSSQLDTLTLSAQTNGIGVGTYAAMVPVTATNATNSPHTLKVTLTIGVGAAASIAANGGTGQSAQVNTPVATPPSVIVRDQFSNPVPGVPVTFAVRSGGGTITGASTTTSAAGIANVGSWTMGTLAGPDSLTATSGSLTGSPVIFVATATPGPATKLTFSGQPSNAQAGAPITPPVQVTVQDAFNNAVSSYATNVAVAIGTNPPGNGTLSGSTSVTPGSGVATFSNLSIDKTGTGYTLVATSGSLPAVTSNGFNIAASSTPAGSLSSLTASVGSITASSGSSTSLITVTVRDTFSNPISGAAVQLGSTGTGNAFSPAASGTTNGSGVFAASFSSTKAEGKTINAVVNGTVAITQTAGVTVTPATASPSVSTLTSSNGAITACNVSCSTGGGTGSAITVTVQDAFGNLIAGATVTLSSTGSSNAFSPTASGTTNGSGVFGATFSSTKAEGKTISATATGAGALTTTAGITVTPAGAATLTINAGNSQVARVGTGVGVLPSVLVRDAFANPVPGVTVSFGSLTGGGSVSGSPATSDGSGIATLGSWTLGATVGDSVHGTYVNGLTATAAGTTSAVFADSAFFSLASDVMPIFAAASAGPCSGCHSPGFTPDFTSATTFFNTTRNVTGVCNNTLLRVAPGDASNSLLMRLLNGSGSGCTPLGVMPNTGALPANQRRVVSDWINRSALNN